MIRPSCSTPSCTRPGLQTVNYGLRCGACLSVLREMPVRVTEADERHDREVLRRADAKVAERMRLRAGLKAPGLGTSLLSAVRFG